MARKDVDLVIRAKDEAENVVKAITKALNDFNGAQKETVGGAEKTDTALGKLGAAFNGLKQAVGGASVGAKIADEMNKADAAVARLEKSTASTRDELARMKAAAGAAEVSLASLTVETEKQAKAQADSVKAIAKAKAELSALRLQTNLLEQASKGLVAQQTKLPETIAKQEAAIAKTAARLAELNAAYAAAANPGKTLTNQVAAANERFAQQNVRLESLKKELTDVGTSLTKTGADMATLAAKAAAAETALKGQTDNLASIKKGYADVSAAARSASQSQVTASVSVDKLTTKLANEEAQLETAKVAFTELSKAVGLSNAELVQLEGQGLSRLQAILTQQKSILAGAKQQYADLSAAALNLAQEIGRVGVPTRKMSEELATLNAQVAGSKAVLDAASATFREMAADFRTGGRDIASLEQIERSFIGTQGQMSAAIRQATTDYQRNLAAIKALHQEQARGGRGTSTTRLPSPVPAAPPVGPWNQLSDAFDRLYGDSRKSLSITQRLRGEVLSLIAAYGGFYGVVNLLGQVLGAYQKIEAANARLNVANSGDLVKTAEDMDFLRRTADRLGVDLGTLAQEYSKFSVATVGTNLAGEKTRKIFLSVAEAARVNRSSTEEISGVFVALTQIVSKGAVQMEELRQQLGDRLPGALQIMADGLNVTTAELIKMLEAGEVTSDALVPFAEQLDKRFGPGLSEALGGTTVALGRLQNAAFQALVQFGEGGFITAFTELANKLTTLLQSADFAAFIEGASSAFAFLIDVLSVVVENFKVLIAVVAGFAALKLTPILIGIVAGFNSLIVATKGAVASQIAIRSAIGATGAVSATAAVGMTAFRAALTALLSSTGIGLAISVIAAGIGYWSVRADEATIAMAKHKEIVDLVKNAYDQTQGSVEGVRDAVGELTVTEAKRSLIELTKAAEEAGDAFQNIAIRGDSSGNFRVTTEQKKEVDALRDAYLGGAIDSKKFLAGIDAVNQKYDDGTQSAQFYADKVIEVTKSLIESQEGFRQAQLLITGLTGELGPAGEAFDELAGKSGDAAENISGDFKSAMDALGKSVEKLAELAPETKAGIDDIAAGADELQKNYNLALQAARQLPDAIMRAAAEQAALNGLAEGMGAAYAAIQGQVDSQFGNFTNGTEAAAALLRDQEGFRETPYWDVNAYRVGFGSDTITLADGTIQKVVQGMSVSVADANRDLLRRITDEFMPIAAGASGGRFDTFTAQQQAALISLAYNYGEIPDRVAEVTQSGGTAADIAEAIRGLQNDNNGINRGRRLEEAALFESSAGVEGAAAEQVRQDEAAAEAAAKRAEEAAKAAAATQQTISDNEFAIGQQAQINAGKEREAAIEAAIRAAKEENVNITDEQLAQIAEQAGRQFDLANAEKAALAPKEAAQKAEEVVNQLLAQRNTLQEQFNIAKLAGDTDGQAVLKEQITGVNEELILAIENAKAMWAAVGGLEADTAIAKLETARLAANNLSVSAKTNYIEWDKVAGLFVDGLAGAFDSFAKQIADGVAPLEALKNSFLQFAADFLLQIAKMIIQQAIFNALQGAFGGTPFGSLIGLAHTGGVVGSKMAGSGNQSRRVSPALFSGAPRYHTGGVVGLRPGEVPLIAKMGEEVLAENDPRNVLNGGLSPAVPSSGAAGASPVKIVNGIDSASFLEAALNTPAGEKVLLNWMRANPDAVSSSRG